MSRIKHRKTKKESEVKDLLLLLLLKFEGPVGRYRLKNMLDLSDHEGVVRLMLTDLSGDNYVSATKVGCKLTEKGEELLASCLRRYDIVSVQDFDAGPLKTAPSSFAIQVKGKAKRMAAVMNQRDAAVRVGALGATILSFEGGRLSIPTVSDDLAREYPGIAEKILQTFSLSDGDVLIIGFSEDRWKALEGALAVAMTLL